MQLLQLLLLSTVINVSLQALTNLISMLLIQENFVNILADAITIIISEMQYYHYVDYCNIINCQYHVMI